MMDFNFKNLQQQQKQLKTKIMGKNKQGKIKSDTKNGLKNESRCEA